MAGVTRRGIVRAGAGIGVVSLLAACSGANTGGAGQPALAKQAVTIRWSTWGDESNPMVQGAAKGIDLFRQKFPNVTVKAEAQVGTPGGPSWDQKNYAEWVAGTGPDVSGSCCNTLPDWGRQGLMLNLDSYIKRDGKAVPLNDYVEFQYKTWNFPDRGQFALPMYLGIFGLYYSKQLFQRKGVKFPDDSWTWDTWRDAMVRLTDKTENTWGYTQSVNFPRPGVLIRQNGGNQVDPKDNKKAVFDSAQAIGALQWMHDRMWKDRTFAMGSDITGASGLGFKNAYNAVAAGKLGMLMEGSWVLARWLGEQPDLVDQWDVAQLPKGAVQRDGGATVDGWGIWSGGKNLDISWELVKFLQSDPWIEIATSIVGQQPARKSWQDKFVELMKKTYPQLASKNLAAFTAPIKGDYAKPEQFYLKDADSKKVWADTVTATFTKNEQPVADAFKAAAQQVNQINAR